MNVSSVASQAGVNSRITPQEVSPAVLKQATGDGDGRTGAAALNDGDKAAQQAAQQVQSSLGRNVDVRA
jgi:hypothetical protein